MTEAEILGLLQQGAQNVLAVVSIFFTIVSAYVAAVYYFLHRAPVMMRLVAFALVTGASVFLGLSTIFTERTMSGLFVALAELPARTAGPPPTGVYFGLDALTSQQMPIGVAIGWILTALIYACLFYLTFLHRWREER